MQCNETTVKISGMTVEKKFFELNLNIVCKKVSHKLHALAAALINYISQGKLKITMKAIIRLQSGYCKLVWMR